MKKFLMCVVTMKSGDTFKNPLKLSEAALISQLAQKHKSVTVESRTCDAAEYKIIFGR